MGITLANNEWEIRAGDLVLTSRSAQIQILDGHSETISSMSAPETIKLGGDKLTFKQKRGDFQVAQEIIADDLSIGWTVVVENKGNTQLWHEVRLGIDIPEDGSFRYWDGYSDRGPVNKKSILAVNANPVGNEKPLPDKLFPLSKEMKDRILKESGGNSQVVMNVMFDGPTKTNVFPMSCVFGENQCVCLGIDPTQLFSYQSSGIEERFYTSVKLVIDPGTSERVTFIAYCTPGTYGWREALSTYYLLFPECFTSRNTIDQRFFGIGETSGYMVNYEASELLWEDRRRFYTQWTWSMHAYEKIGLVFPSEDDFDPYGTFVEKSVRGRSREEFLRVVRESYRRADATTATAYYILPQVLDKETVEKNYIDAKWVTSHGQTLLIDFTNESQKGKVESYAVLPLGNSYGHRTSSDLPKIASSIQPRGIAFDNVEGPRMDFAPHAQKCPGRAFAEGKVYVTQAIAYAKLMQIVRDLPSHDGKMAVLGNHPGSYHTATLTDLAIVEAGPWTDPESTMALRYAMGSKPIVFWGPKEFSGCHSFTGQQFTDKLNHINHWLFLFALRTGILPNAAINIKGYPQMLARVPLLLKIARAGWQSIPGARCNSDKLSIERFGKEYLNIVNENNRFITTTVQVNPSYFIDNTTGFNIVYGEIKTQQFSNAEINIAIQVPPMEAVVLRSNMAVDPPEPIALLGKKESILEFRFLDGKQPVAQISLEDTHTGKEYFLARRIVAYFKYYSLQTRYGNESMPYYYQVYHLQDLAKRQAPELPILRWSQRDKKKPTIRLHLGIDPQLPNELRIPLSDGKRGLIGVVDQTLHVMGTTIDALEKATLELLRLLDERYEFHGKRWFEMRREQKAEEAALMGVLE